jgi:hypothetical protein
MAAVQEGKRLWEGRAEVEEGQALTANGTMMGGGNVVL